MAKKSRKTRQKELILNEINGMKQFFTAEDLYHTVEKIDPKVGIATVYRALKNFSNEEKIHSYICDRRTIYSKHKNNHSHFICEKCGKIAHFDVKSVDFFKNKIEGNICHFQLDVYGICKNCKK